jgi:phosphoglycerate dehydrogenase-like enzyme
MPTTRILLSSAFIAQFAPRLNEMRAWFGHDVEFVAWDGGNGALGLIDIAFLTRDVQFSPSYPAFGNALLRCTTVKWVHFPSTEIDHHAFVAALHRRGVILTTSAGSNGEPVAQTAITGLLMLARGFPHWLDAQRRHAWERFEGAAVPRDLRGQTVVVVGLGTIGGTIARLCSALGMRVIGIRRNPTSGTGAPLEEVHSPAALVDLLPRCDWLVLACPHTPDTHHMIDATALASMRPGAGLVNVARGGLVDEAALREALASGRLACAYLDVFEHEPLPADSPLWDMQNVIITPHNAAASSGNDERAAEQFFENLRRWSRNEPLRNVAAF